MIVLSKKIDSFYIILFFLWYNILKNGGISSMTNFETFVENRYKCYLFDRGGLFQVQINETKQIAKSHIYIINITFQSATSNSINVRIYFKDFNDPTDHNDLIFEKCIDIEVFPKKKSISADWDDFMKIIKKTYKKENKAVLLSIYKEYFKAYIVSYIKQHPEFLMKCGWLKIYNKKEFLSVTYTEETYPEFVKDLFDGNINKNEKLAKLFSNLCEEVNATENLFEFILCDPCVLTIFAYSIYAILWNYVNDYSFSDKENFSIFSLCVYGNNPSISKILANLLLNFFTVKPNKWTVIERKYHISATSLSQKTINNLFLYKSIPIIITSKNNHFTKTSSIMGKIHRKCENNEINIYPVYISNCPVLADEILNCCSDLLELEQFNLEKLREQFIALIYDYINYLSNISITNTRSENFHNNNLGESYYIKKNYTECSREYIYSRNLDAPLLNEWLNKNFKKDCFNDFILEEWLNNYYSEESDEILKLGMKKHLLTKWLKQYNLNKFCKEEEISEMILEDILSVWNNVETIPKFDIPHELDQIEEILRCKIFNEWKCQQSKFNTLRRNLITKWLDTHFPEFRLYQTIDIFCNYLKSTPLKKFVNSLKNYAKKCFLPQIQNESFKLSSPKVNYLNLLYLFIQKNLNNVKNNTWLWEGQEPRGEKEFCYYLSCQQGLDEFNKFISESSCPIIQKRKFDQLLKENKILKLPKGNSNTWKRKKTSVYVFIKKELDKFSLNN